MTQDIVRRLGYLCLGSRLRRIGERLQADVHDMARDVPLDLRPSQHPLLAALDLEGPMTVNALVGAVGISQPGVTAAVARLAETGLVALDRDPDDQRHKRVSLTRTGRDIVDRAKRDLWPRVEAAVIDLCENAGGDLLAQLDAIETALDARPLGARVGAAEEPA